MPRPLAVVVVAIAAALTLTAAAQSKAPAQCETVRGYLNAREPADVQVVGAYGRTVRRVTECALFLETPNGAGCIRIDVTRGRAVSRGAVDCLHPFNGLPVA